MLFSDDPSSPRRFWSTVSTFYADEAVGGSVNFEHGRTPVDILRLPQIKFVCLIPKPESMAADAFHRYWLEQHGPTIRSLSKDLGILRYVQSHLVPSAAIETFARERGWQPNRFQGMTEVWWQSEAHMTQMLTSEAGRVASRVAAEDERRFSDDGVIVFTTREYVVVDQGQRAAEPGLRS